MHGHPLANPEKVLIKAAFIRRCRGSEVLEYADLSKPYPGSALAKGGHVTGKLVIHVAT